MLLVDMDTPSAAEPGHPAGCIAGQSHISRQRGDDLQATTAFGVYVAVVAFRPWAAGVLNRHAYRLSGTGNFHAELPAG
jgi:hypothetical protein